MSAATDICKDDARALDAALGMLGCFLHVPRKEAEWMVRRSVVLHDEGMSPQAAAQTVHRERTLRPWQEWGPDMPRF